MRQRCNNPKANGFIDYGGRGISVCHAWGKFTNFLEWANINGYEDSLSIERIDVDGNYCPDNCHWATTTVQACNKRKRKGKTSQFIGVAPNRENWQAYIDYKGVRTNLGTYSTDTEAAAARDNHVKANGLPHKLNF